MTRADIGDYKKIPVTEFQKLQLRVGTIVKIEPHPKSPRHYCIAIDCSAADEDVRVVAALAQHYQMSELIGKQVTVACNLPPQTIMGVDSDAMLLVSHNGKKPVLLGPHFACPAGADVMALSDKEYKHTLEQR